MYSEFIKLEGIAIMVEASGLKFLNSLLPQVHSLIGLSQHFILQREIVYSDLSGARISLQTFFECDLD